MSEQLFLNKKRVDLLPKPITRKIQIADIGDIASRKSTYSYSIKIPRTSNNIQVLDMLGVIGNVSRKPFENVVADYVVDGVPLVVNGYVVISSTGEYYELNIYDGVIDLGEKLKGKKMSDLQLINLNHILTAQEVVDSFSNSEGFIYGLANFGLGIYSNVKVEQIAPSIFTHTLFRKIFESIGLNLIGDFFNSNENYLTEVVTPEKGIIIEDSAFESFSKGSFSTLSVYEYDSSNTYIDFEIQLEPFGIMEGASVDGKEIVFDIAGTYKIEIDVTYYTYRTYLSFYVVIADKAQVYQSLSGYSNNGSQNGTKKVSMTFTVEEGDKVSFWIYGSSYYDGYYNGGNYDYYEVNYQVETSGLLFLQEGGQLINMKDYLGETLQLDFVKDIINRYGLVLNPISNSSDYNFKQIEELLLDRENAEDWTEKLKKINGEDYVSGYAKKNIAAYQYPEEILVPNNDGEIVTENENAETEKNLFTSIFQIPNEAGGLLGKTAYSIPLWETKIENSISVIKLKETPIKVMRLTRVDSYVTVGLFNDVTPIVVEEGVPVLTLENMFLNYNLVNYYKAFKNLINNYKEVDCEVNLSIIDVFNLDFFRLKYLKQTGRYYYLNTVTHTPSKLSKAVMIEISRFEVNQAPSAVGKYEFPMYYKSTSIVSAASLLAGYIDPEFDPPFKIKIISGFNSDMIMTQAGVEITSEIEILVEDLDLKIIDVLGGLAAYSKSWSFTVSDTVSERYSSGIGIIKTNRLELINEAPIANAGTDQTKGLYDEQYNPQTVYFSLDGSGSYDWTGNIVSYVWTLESFPAQNGGANDTVLYTQTNNSSASFEIPNELSYTGTYVLKLVVTDEFGLSAEDTVSLIVNEGDWYGEEPI